MEPRHVARGPVLEFVRVDEVLLRMTAAEEEDGLAGRRAVGDQRGAFLQEAAKRREARARPHHDDRARGIVRQSKAFRRRLPHHAMHRFAGLCARKEVGADAFEAPEARPCRAGDYADRDAAAAAITGESDPMDRMLPTKGFFAGCGIGKSAFLPAMVLPFAGADCGPRVRVPQHLDGAGGWRAGVFPDQGLTILQSVPCASSLPV